MYYTTRPQWSPFNVGTTKTKIILTFDMHSYSAIQVVNRPNNLVINVGVTLSRSGQNAMTFEKTLEEGHGCWDIDRRASCTR